MVGKAVTVTLVVLVAALAGCSGNGSGDGSDPLDDANLEDTVNQDLDLKATATTGVIRGVVVDAAIVPIAAAHVTVKVADKTLQTNTTPSGSFGFQGLESGTYFVKVMKPGYTETQQSVEVQAGVDEPAILKVKLDVDKSFRKPYFNVVKYEGFVECTTSVLVLCGAPNLLTGENYTNDRFTWDQYFDDNASMIQSELFWDTTQAASPELYFEMEMLNGGCDADDVFLNSTVGSSPIYTTVSQEQIEDGKVGTVCPIYYSIFSGDAVRGVSGQDSPSPIGVGATVEQPFTMIMHSFYGFTPPAGWRFSVNGNPEVPK